MFMTILDGDEQYWHQKHVVETPTHFPLPEPTQFRADSDANGRYCGNCQHVGSFILTQPLLNRIPDTHAYHRVEQDHDGKPYYEKQHDMIRLGNLADLQANHDCICCQSIVSALLEQGVATQGQLQSREAELCWNGGIFSCILHCHDTNDIKALQLRLTKLPSNLESLNPSSFPYWRYNRLMDVNKIDTTVIQGWIESCDRLHETEAQSIAPLLSASELPWIYLIDLERQCLVKVDTAQSPRYMALSYVWGGVDMLKTTTASLGKLLQPGALLDIQETSGPKLAQTIVDAMDLARKLGCSFFFGQTAYALSKTRKMNEPCFCTEWLPYMPTHT